MDEDLRKKIAMFRYSLIAPILNENFHHNTFSDYLKDICGKEYEVPLGLKKEYALATIKEWLGVYKRKSIL